MTQLTRYYLEKPLTADGKQSRGFVASKEPYSRLQWRGLSDPARALIQARSGERDAEQYLITYLARIIQKHGQFHDWRIDDQGNRSTGLAKVVLYPYVYRDKPLSHQKSAKVMGIRKSAYQKTWLPRTPTFINWCEGLTNEHQTIG